MSKVRLTREVMDRAHDGGPLSGDEMATLFGLTGELPDSVLTLAGRWVRVADDGSYERSPLRIPPHDPSALETKRFGW